MPVADASSRVKPGLPELGTAKVADRKPSPDFHWSSPEDELGTGRKRVMQTDKADMDQIRGSGKHVRAGPFRGLSFLIERAVTSASGIPDERATLRGKKILFQP